MDLKEVVDKAHELSLVEPRSITTAMDLIFDSFDDALIEAYLKGAPEKVRDVFEATFYAAETLTDVALLLGIMTITNTYRTELMPAREACYLKIKLLLAAEEAEGGADRLEDITMGLWP